MNDEKKGLNRERKRFRVRKRKNALSQIDDDNGEKDKDPVDDLIEVPDSEKKISKEIRKTMMGVMMRESHGFRISRRGLRPERGGCSPGPRHDANLVQRV